MEFLRQRCAGGTQIILSSSPEHPHLSQRRTVPAKWVKACFWHHLDFLLLFRMMSSNWKVNESLMSTYTWALGASTTMGRCSYGKHFLSVHYLLESMVGAGDTEAKKTQSHHSRNLQDSREMETWNVIIIKKKKKGIHNYHWLRAHHKKPGFVLRVYVHYLIQSSKTSWRKELLTRFFR